MPGPHPPPPLPHMPMPRRQPSDYHYGMPPPTQSPVHGMYMGYPPQPPYHPHAHPQQSYAPPHWQPYAPYPQQQYPPPPQPHMRPPYHHQPAVQHMPPPQPIPQHNPIVVSSHPNGQPVTPIPRVAMHPPPVMHTPVMQTPVMQTPPVLQSTPVMHTPPAVQSPTPQQMPFRHTLPAKPQVASPPTPDVSVSTTSSQAVASPQMSSTPTLPPTPVTIYMPNFPKLPWLSVPEEDFPPRSSRRRRRRNMAQESDLQLPERQPEEPIEETAARPNDSQTSTIVASESATSSHAPSETDSTNPTSPSSTAPTVTTPRAAPTVPAHSRASTRTAIPLIPVTPVIPNIPQRSRKPSEPSHAAESKPSASTVPAADTAPAVDSSTAPPDSTASEQPATPASPPKPAAPKSWADLVRSKAALATAPAVQPVTNGATAVNGLSGSNTGVLCEVLRLFSVDAEHKLSFLEPRGLVNTGNMCYMNSILQVLLYSTPFYAFLDQVGKRALHSFKSDTPLLDSMIEFMREFKVIDSAVPGSQLRLRLKEHEFEQFGSAFTPEYVYDAIKRVPRFSSMKRGHQQDAEEFLGFLLDTLHEECARVISSSGGAKSTRSSSISTTRSNPDTDESDWLEVGPKQKSAVTRTSGPALANSPPTPISKIFSGHLRSELRVQGLKTSVTLEPFQPLQLDIQAPHINTITDALRGITKPETLTGDWGSPRGVRTATKQVFIEHLPTVLVLHLKRFGYDRASSSSGSPVPAEALGARKIWKTIKYPLELEIPREVLAPSRRAALAARAATGNSGLRYQLVSVVYHHGKHAGGGHYTVDVRRQDGKDWVRIDDTVVRRIAAEDVVGKDSEQDEAAATKAIAKSGGAKKEERRANFFEQGMLDEEGEEETEAWEDANGAGVGTGRWAEKVNGTAAVVADGKRARELGVKEGKVAYILFYQQVKE